MAGKHIDLMDIADDLLIINKKTIDTLTELDNASDCIALYIFYYKTAKWQKTNQVKASDSYVKKCLGWGSKRLHNAKETLMKHGLVRKVQRRKEDGTIDGWYIRIEYMISGKDIKNIHNTRKQQVDEATSGCQTTSAYKTNIK